MTFEKNCYKQGWDAEEEGKKEEDNPYKDGTVDFKRWEKGYIAAEIFHHPELYDHGD